MNTEAFLQWCFDTGLGAFMRDVSWAFPTMEIVHFIGLCLLFGVMLVVDLRLLGFLRRLPVDAVLRLLPLALIGFFLNAASGIAFFCFSPDDYWFNPLFKLKLVLMLVAGLNALGFTIFHFRQQHSGQTALAGWAGKISAGGSLLIWTIVIVLGRSLPYFNPNGLG